MNDNFIFTFQNIEGQYAKALELGYKIMTCEGVGVKTKKEDLIIVNRVDVDFSVKKALRLSNIFNKLSIKASFFFRLHAPEYDPLSFENYKIIRQIHNDGHEIGYHSEIIDMEAIWGDDAASCLEKDLKVFENYYGIKIKGVASHGGLTGLNNLEFWKKEKPANFGLLYEAYDEEPLLIYLITLSIFQIQNGQDGSVIKMAQSSKMTLEASDILTNFLAWYTC